MDASNAAPPVPGTLSTTTARSVRAAVQRAYQRLVNARPDLPRTADAQLWIERAVTVLAHNVASGRFARVHRGEQDASAALLTYAQQVLTQLLTEWDRIESLRAGDSVRWTVVIQQMERQAYHWLGPGGREEWARWEARDAAARTCADLWQWLQRNPFPFDVSFDRWSQRALRYRLRDSVGRRRTEARYVVDSLDRPCLEEGVTYGELLPADDLAAWLELESRREELRGALSRLDARQARILHLWYLEGWSVDEIAAETALAAGHVYVLKHRALKKLRAYCVKE